MPTPLHSSIEINTEEDVRRARTHARTIVQRAGLGEAVEVRLVTIVSELSRNIIKYAGQGTCEFDLLSGFGLTRVICTCRDHGTGIADVEAALTDGYSTGKTLGLGLPGVKWLADSFHLKTGADGTVIEIEVHARTTQTRRDTVMPRNA